MGETKTGLSIEELVPIHRALNNLLMIKGTGLTYTITKNIVLIDRAIKSYSKELQVLQKTFYIKDADGNPIKYAALKNDNGQLSLRLVDDKPVEAAPGEQNSLYRIEDSEESIKAFKELNEEKYDLDFHKIDENAIEQLCKSNVIEGVDFSALLDVIIS